ncbi:MAG TPA: mechanosensitive ion channel family protein [Acidobacteriota bacterium]|nr:mechanosensitive ion channel family protein [Acidobacteriota bacterium]
MLPTRSAGGATGAAAGTVPVAAVDTVALLISIGVLVLMTVLALRLSGILIGRMEDAIRRGPGGEPEAREKRAKTIGGVLRGAARALILVVAALMAVREAGLDITPAVAAAGGFGVAAGLGAQSLVRDWIAGLFIIHDDQYAVGDVVRAAGVAGTIEQLSLRHTELRDGDGSLHFIPNGEIKVVTNLTKSWAAPLIRIPVSLDEDPDRVLRVLESMVDGFRADPAMAPLLQDGPKVLGVDDVGAGQFTVLVQARTKPQHRYQVMRSLRLAAMRRLREEGIALQAPSNGGTTA